MDDNGVLLGEYQGNELSVVSEDPRVARIPVTLSDGRQIEIHVDEPRAHELVVGLLVFFGLSPDPSADAASRH